MHGCGAPAARGLAFTVSWWPARRTRIVARRTPFLPFIPQSRCTAASAASFGLSPLVFLALRAASPRRQSIQGSSSTGPLLMLPSVSAASCREPVVLGHRTSFPRRQRA